MVASLKNCRSAVGATVHSLRKQSVYQNRARQRALSCKSAWVRLFRPSLGRIQARWIGANL
jgi:hypothetical protein